MRRSESRHRFVERGQAQAFTPPATCDRRLVAVGAARPFPPGLRAFRPASRPAKGKRESETQREAEPEVRPPETDE